MITNQERLKNFIQNIFNLKKSATQIITYFIIFTIIILTFYFNTLNTLQKDALMNFTSFHSEDVCEEIKIDRFKKQCDFVENKLNNDKEYIERRNASKNAYIQSGTSFFSRSVFFDNYIKNNETMFTFLTYKNNKKAMYKSEYKGTEFKVSEEKSAKQLKATLHSLKSSAESFKSLLKELVNPLPVLLNGLFIFVLYKLLFVLYGSYAVYSMNKHNDNDNEKQVALRLIESKDNIIFFVIFAMLFQVLL